MHGYNMSFAGPELPRGPEVPVHKLRLQVLHEAEAGRAPGGAREGECAGATQDWRRAAAAAGSGGVQGADGGGAGGGAGGPGHAPPGGRGQLPH